MATATLTGAARPAARISMDGALARRFRREAFSEYARCCEMITDRLKHGDVIDDPEATEDLMTARADLSEWDAILDQLGWDGEIDLASDVDVIASASLLERVVLTFLWCQAEGLQKAADDGEVAAIDERLGELGRWRSALDEIHRTTGQDL